MGNQGAEAIIAMLNEDLKGEHAAIVQYLRHAYSMGEGEMACEIEAIARDEMRHLDWLAEQIVELGGEPALDRGEMTIGGDTIAEWMQRDIGLEKDAIALYEEHIEAIDDPKIKRLLRRILSDEVAHQNDFKHFVEKSKREGMEPVAPLEAKGDKASPLAEMLNWGVRHEYTVVLQYLYHSYLTDDVEISQQMEDQAINEMQHLGWLAEELTDSGSAPDIEETGVDRSKETPDMLRADIKVEREVTEEYSRQIGEVDDPDLQRLLTRIRDNEIYHDEVFSDLLEGLGD
jgi:bacterioferritin